MITCGRHSHTWAAPATPLPPEQTVRPRPLNTKRYSYRDPTWAQSRAEKRDQRAGQDQETEQRKLFLTIYL